ncbi:unnamed protein product [Dicrocoelium dendriticum]|nr:unnamed protein product [Dicrocoelium dendriticum]
MDDSTKGSEEAIAMLGHSKVVWCTLSHLSKCSRVDSQTAVVLVIRSFWFPFSNQADPKSELIHELLGQLAVEQGDFDTALDHFNKAIQEAKTKNDLSHLIALREGVIAQSNVCQKYGIPVLDVVNSLKREQQQMMMGMM